MNDITTRSLTFKAVTIDWERDLDDTRHAYIKAVAEETLRATAGGTATYEVAWYAHPTEGWQVVHCLVEKFTTPRRGECNLVFRDYAADDDQAAAEELFLKHVGVATWDEDNSLHRQLDQIESEMYEEGRRAMQKRADRLRLKFTVEFTREEVGA